MINSLTYSTIEYIRGNYKDIFKNIIDKNIEEHLYQKIGATYKETTKFINPRIHFDMSNTNDPKKTDYQNAKMIHDAFINLTESQASDFRLWSGYAITQEVYDYLKYRWQDNEKTILYRITGHTNGKRGLAYQGISRLWWFAHLTYDKNKDDPYELTQFTFHYPHIMEKMIYRNYSNSKTIRFGIIRGIKAFIEEGGEYHTNKLDDLYKYISLLSGVNILDIISEDEIMRLSLNFLRTL